jgi:hypothetical protein
MKRCLVLVGVTVIVCSAVLLAQAPAREENPIIGTWKQNMEKSTYSPGPPPEDSTSVRQYAAGEEGAVVAVTMNIDPHGLPSLGAISAANYDGKEYVQYTVSTLATSLSSHISPPVKRTISYKPIDRYTVEIVQRQDGRVVSSSKRTISTDGKTMTERFDFVNEQGRRVTNVLVFEKQ